jgi:hypothetical protein
MNYLLLAALLLVTASAGEGPKVFLNSHSTGNTWAARRDQSQEMARDLEKDCPSARVTMNQDEADYQLTLNHVEAGLFVRDNQLAVSDMFGNLLSTREKGGIRGGLKEACALILADWSNPKSTRQKLINAVSAGARKEGVAAYAEISGDRLTVHSERASAMRFHMIVASERYVSMVRRAGIDIYAYTNDADQNFTYDVKSGQSVETAAKAR